MLYAQQVGYGTARSVEDETRNAELNGNRYPEWWKDFSKLQIQIKRKSQFEFLLQDTSEFKSKQNLNLTLYHEIPRNLIFSILTRRLKSPHDSGFRLLFGISSLIFHGTGCSVPGSVHTVSVDMVILLLYDTNIRATIYLNNAT